MHAVQISFWFSRIERHSNFSLIQRVGSITDSNGNHRLEGKRACASDYRILRKSFQRNALQHVCAWHSSITNLELDL